MTDHSSVYISPPRNWQDFERNTRILFECILNDIHVQTNGRPGQRQHGVDIFGRQNGEGPWWGIQCKGKDNGYGAQVTEKELRAEVEKTRKFRPLIEHFILVTTSPDDAAIQKVARIITEERTQEGNPLYVSVWGWGELQSRIAQYQPALQAFHPDATLFTDQILKYDASHDTKLVLIIQLVQHQNRPVLGADSTSVALEVFDKNLHAEIDGYRDLIKVGRSRTAIGFLERLRDRIWESASDRVKFRIITNIAACYVQMGNDAAASELYLTAVTFQPKDKVAMANVALAYLLKGESANAVAAATAALAEDETNADAASYLIQAQIENVEVVDPLELVPETLKESEAVAIGCMHFYRMRNDLRWVDVAKAAVDRHHDNDRIKRYAAEAELEQVVGIDGVRFGQRPPEPMDWDALRHAAAVLQEQWDQQYTSEFPGGDPSLAVNLIQIYRIIDNDAAARRVSEQALERMPDESNLIKLHVASHLDEYRRHEALPMLERLADDPESLLLLAETRAANNPEAALETLKTFEQLEDVRPYFQVMAIGLRVNIWLNHPLLSAVERVKAADGELSILHERFPKSPMTAIAHAQILQAKDAGPASVKQVLIDAKAKLTEETPFFERYLLADKLKSVEAYADVADVLDGFIDLSHDSPALQTLVIALVNSDERAKAHRLLTGMRATIAETPFYLRAAVFLHLRRGDFPAAERAITRLLERDIYR